MNQERQQEEVEGEEGESRSEEGRGEKRQERCFLRKMETSGKKDGTNKDVFFFFEKGTMTGLMGIKRGVN